jgi:hypothetical protein
MAGIAFGVVTKKGTLAMVVCLFLNTVLLVECQGLAGIFNEQILGIRQLRLILLFNRTNEYRKFPA